MALSIPRTLRLVQKFRNEGLVFCLNSSVLIVELKMLYDPNKLRLLKELSKMNFRVVFLANRNELSSVPIACSVDIKEMFENIR